MVVIDATTSLRSLQPGTPEPDGRGRKTPPSRPRARQTDLFAEGEVRP